MQDAGVVTIPAVTEDNVLEGLITVGGYNALLYECI